MTTMIILLREVWDHSIMVSGFDLRLVRTTLKRFLLQILRAFENRETPNPASSQLVE